MISTLSLLSCVQPPRSWHSFREEIMSVLYKLREKFKNIYTTVFGLFWKPNVSNESVERERERTFLTTQLSTQYHIPPTHQTHSRTQKHKHPHTHTYTHAHMHKHTNTHTHKHTNTHTHTHTHTHTYIHYWHTLIPDIPISRPVQSQHRVNIFLYFL